MLKITWTGKSKDNTLDPTIEALYEERERERVYSEILEDAEVKIKSERIDIYLRKKILGEDVYDDTKKAIDEFGFNPTEKSKEKYPKAQICSQPQICSEPVQIYSTYPFDIVYEQIVNLLAKL